MLSRDAARRVLDETRHFEDSVAIVFDRPDERQIVFERMDWSHPNRRGYYEKNKAFIADTPSPLRDMLTEDPIQVMFNGGVEPMRALVASLRAMPIADQFSVAITEYVPRDFSLVDVNGTGCSKGTTLAGRGRSRRSETARTRRRASHTQEVPERLLDEAGQPFPVAQAGGLRAKGLEVIAHDLVERTLRGRPRFVAR